MFNIDSSNLPGQIEAALHYLRYTQKVENPKEVCGAPLAGYNPTSTELEVKESAPHRVAGIFQPIHTERGVGESKAKLDLGIFLPPSGAMTITLSHGRLAAYDCRVKKSGLMPEENQLNQSGKSAHSPLRKRTMNYEPPFDRRQPDIMSAEPLCCSPDGHWIFSAQDLPELPIPRYVEVTNDFINIDGWVFPSSYVSKSMLVWLQPSLIRWTKEDASKRNREWIGGIAEAFQYGLARKL